MKTSRKILARLGACLPLLSITAATAFGQMPALPPKPPRETIFFPLAEVHRGLQGVAYTVFEGVEPEPMGVEILGVLKNAIGPGQDMILARLHGTKAEYTGVVAGMSGSPVYIDGRLVGALSYRIGQFSKEPIAGITPIEAMLEVRDHQQQGGSPRAAGEGQPEVKPIETPLVFNGFSQETVERFGDRFRAMGLTPVAGLGGADPEAKQPEPIVPGSAVSAILVRGDLSMAGTCTVTYLDAKQLMACGHPITQYGSLSLPMTKANVVATLPSPLNAFKIVNTTETVGSFTEDRASAILGRFDRTARMIPASVEVLAPGKKPHTYRFEVLDNRQLTPNAMLVSVYQALQGTNDSAAENSYRMTGELTTQGFAPVRLEGVMAPSDFNPGAVAAALYINERFSRVYGNALEQPVVTGLHLKVEAIPERRTAVIESARLSQTEARAGDTVEVEATVRPYQSKPMVVRIPVKLPSDLSAGQIRILVSDGGTLDRLTQPSGAHPAGLADTIAQLNQLHPGDRVFCTLLDHAAQAVLESGALPGLPISMANVLEPLKQTHEMQLTGETVVAAGSAGVDYAVTGTQILMLTIR
ncbi:SpoIVB peptidase S55 domain-containing protein [Granulicella rosea]|nr:SpoIVB peptidase S55 domain-containing protein [Granulicella rosea]